MATVLALAALLAKDASAEDAGGTCTKSCGVNNQCIQGNFTQCNVLCDNTGVSSIVGTCQSAHFINSAVTCTAAGACRSAAFWDESVVECTGQDSCRDSTAWESQLSCAETSCGGAHFYASAISCSGSYSLNSCHDILFTPCTCCDGPCAQGMASCRDNTIGFCSSTYLGRNCQEWGNPACNGLAIGTHKRINFPSRPCDR
jgi:hypothetical protein